jgi:hypothetical protein
MRITIREREMKEWHSRSPSLQTPHIQIGAASRSLARNELAVKFCAWSADPSNKNVRKNNVSFVATNRSPEDLQV